MWSCRRPCARLIGSARLGGACSRPARVGQRSRREITIDPSPLLSARPPLQRITRDGPRRSCRASAPPRTLAARHLPWGFFPLQHIPDPRSVRGETWANARSPRAGLPTPAHCAFGVPRAPGALLLASPGSAPPLAGRCSVPGLRPSEPPSPGRDEAFRPAFPSCGFHRAGVPPPLPPGPGGSIFQLPRPPFGNRTQRPHHRRWAAPGGCSPRRRRFPRAVHDRARGPHLSWVFPSPGSVPDGVGGCFHPPPPSRFLPPCGPNRARAGSRNTRIHRSLPASSQVRAAPRSLDHPSGSSRPLGLDIPS